MDQELKNSILKTGTTILGIVCKDGIVMASDRQVTGGRSVVMDKNFSKTNKINNYVVVSWAGQVSGAQRLSKLIAAELKLKELRSKSRPNMKKVGNLVASISYSSIRQPSMVPNIVSTLVGGVNEDGSTELYEIGIDGSLIKSENYVANGSGMSYVLGLLERQYKQGVTVKDGIELAKEALLSSTQRDVYSGYGIDIFTITKSGIKKVVAQEFKNELIDN
ncbi:MAG: proteasome subunit beta [archaeon]